VKNIITFLFILTSIQVAIAQFEIEYSNCEIISEVEYPPPCGYYETAMRIEVLLIDSNHKIDLIISCPSFYGVNFIAKGKKYSIEYVAIFPIDYSPIVVPYDKKWKNGIKNTDYYLTAINSD